MLRGEVGSGINVRIMSMEKREAAFVSQHVYLSFRSSVLANRGWPLFCQAENVLDFCCFQLSHTFPSASLLPLPMCCSENVLSRRLPHPPACSPKKVALWMVLTPAAHVAFKACLPARRSTHLHHNALSLRILWSAARFVSSQGVSE